MDVTAAEFKTKLEGMLATIDAEKAEVAAELQKLKALIDGSVGGGVIPGSIITQADLNEMNEILDRAIDKVKGIFNVGAGTTPAPPFDGGTPTEFTNPRTDSNGNRFDASGNIVSADGTVLFVVGSFVLDSSGRAMNSDGTAIIT